MDWGSRGGRGALARSGGVWRGSIPVAVQGPARVPQSTPACSACQRAPHADILGVWRGSACGRTGQEHVLCICVCVSAVPGCFSNTQMPWPGAFAQGCGFPARNPLCRRCGALQATGESKELEFEAAWNSEFS